LRLAEALDINVGDVFSLHPWVEQSPAEPAREHAR
jgi:hypothetical protein